MTHSHREVFALGERVLVLEDGRIVADGTPEQVMEYPAHERVAQLAGFENLLDAAVVQRRPDAGMMVSRLAGTTVELETPLADVEVGRPLRVAIRAGDILIATEPPRGLSARNHPAGHHRHAVSTRSVRSGGCRCRRARRSARDADGD